MLDLSKEYFARESKAFGFVGDIVLTIEATTTRHEHDCVHVDVCCYIDDETGSCLDVALDAEGALAISHALDWALLEIPPGYPITQYTNCTVWKGETLRVKRVAGCDPENEEVLILREEDWPMRAFCSGTPSIITCGRFMGLAFTLQAIKGGEQFQSGVSGSWVINRSTGDLYGIVVAGFEGDDDEVYMVRASDVFADIARTCGVEPKFPLRSSDETETARAVSGLDNRHTDLGGFTTFGGSREASALATDVEIPITDVSRQTEGLNSFFTQQRLAEINETAAPPSGQSTAAHFGVKKTSRPRDVARNTKVKDHPSGLSREPREVYYYKCCQCGTTNRWRVSKCDKIMSDGYQCAHQRNENHCEVIVREQPAGRLGSVSA